jgi:hypothetical protein
MKNHASNARKASTTMITMMRSSGVTPPSRSRSQLTRSPRALRSHETWRLTVAGRPTSAS